MADTAAPTVPSAPASLLVAPKHHLTLRFEATQESYRRIPNEHYAAMAFTFDSKTATLILKDEYLAGRDPNTASGHCWYGEMQGPWPSPKTLRVLWWEITYKDGSEWIAGAILSESTPPVGRIEGKGQAKLNGGQWNGFWPAKNDAFIDGIEIPDQMGACFGWFEPKPWPHTEKMKWWFQRSPQAVPSALNFAPIEAPDFAGGQWQWDYDPQDRSADARYFGDGRSNPNIAQIVGDLPLRRVYPRQTHSHYITQQCSMHFEAWLNATKLGDKTKAQEILRALHQNSQVQTGAFSPKLGPPKWISGRPQYLTINAQGDQPTRGVRYKLTKVDTDAVRPFILHEGRVEIGGMWQFTECFGRDQLDPHDLGMNELQARTSQFGGQYGTANGHQEFEHGGWLVSDCAAWTLYGDPLALRRVRHTAEGHVTVALQAHSSRSTCGWRPNDEQLAAFAMANTAWDADARRYAGDARDAARWTWTHKLSETPYRALLTRGYEYLKPYPRSYEIDEALGYDPRYAGILEGSFQLAIATLNFVQSSRMEPDGFWRNLYLTLVRYCADCAMQPGVVDAERGILDSYPVIGPDPAAPIDAATGKPSIPIGLEMRAAPHQSRGWISDEGWLGPAMAGAALVLQDRKVEAFAKLIYLKQLAQRVQGGQSFLSPNLGNIWQMHREQAKAADVFGWPKA